MALGKPRIRTGGSMGNAQVVDPTVRINKILEAGFNVFELRHKKASPYNKTIMGFDDVDVQLRTSIQSHEVSYSTKVVTGRMLSFEPDEQNILYAFLPDTEKNRRLLAKQIYSCEWVIVQLITPTGNVPSVQINAEIQKAAEILKVEKPLPIARMDLRIKGQRNRADDVYKALNENEKAQLKDLLSGKVSKETPKTQVSNYVQKPAEQLGAVPQPGQVRQPVQFPDEMAQPQQEQAPPQGGVQQPPQVEPDGQPIQEQPLNPQPPPPPEPAEPVEPMTKEKATDAILKQNSALVNILQKKSPTGWKSTTEYREVIVPQINELMAAQVKPQTQAAQPGAPTGAPADLTGQMAGT